MMMVTRKQRIWLAEHRVDFRKSHSGLLAEAYKMSLNPFAGDVVIFIGRNRRRLKVLYADSTGLWVSTKSFTVEAMKTKFKFLHEPSCKFITTADLGMLIEGASYTIEKKVRSYAQPVENKNSLNENSTSSPMM
jgi:IS66 Orf2 like protein